MGNRLGSTILTLTALALVSVLCVTHADDVAAAFTTVPAWVLAAIVALHIGTLVLRSEAWRLTLASAGADVLTRGVATLSAIRIWLVLLACGLPHGLGDVVWVYAALGVVGLLPLGPGAPAGATLVAFGGASVGAAVAAGLMLSASTIIAVVGYALGVALAARIPLWTRPRARVPAAPFMPRT